ncbi:MAG: TIGR01777 family protein [Balneolaceae bacterium]|nr:MAG: TIGR01777 family protein [Balneolaceae bacterium]
MESKKILITGGTGFIGGYLGQELLREGHYLTILTRNPENYIEKQAKNHAYISWSQDIAERMEESDVVINLAGENLFGQRWSDSVKKRIYNSRIETTRKLVEQMRKADRKPELFISASAVGIYGDSGDTVLDEQSETGSDFLADVCEDWEKEALKAEGLGVRVALPRIGIVLEKDGGVVEKMRLPFLFFAGGAIGSGRQYVPWIHMRDLCRAILYPMHFTELSGAYNACSPAPETMSTLSSAMGRVLNRPSLFRVPELALKIALGEAAQPVLGSLRVQPKKLLDSGFSFEFEDLEEALADIL